MKLILDIKDNKAKFILELLSNFSFVKARAIDEGVGEMSDELKEALEHGYKAISEGEYSTSESVLRESKIKYPNLFE